MKIKLPKFKIKLKKFTKKQKIILLLGGLALIIVIALVVYDQTKKNAVEINNPNDEKVITTSSIELDITNNQISRPEIIVKVGTKVTWINKDNQSHLMESISQSENPIFSFVTEEIKPSSSYSIFFTQLGTWQYQDRLNPDITGQVTVR